jgi:formylglycine-generating enzyme required for sulfatase activity
LKKVEQCDVFVLVLGQAITRPVIREYWRARKHKKPRLVFLKKCARTPAVQKFIEIIRGEVKYAEFAQTNDLDRQIWQAVGALLIDGVRKYKLSANDIVILTGFLSQLPKLESLIQPAETPPTEDAPRVHVLEPEKPRIETPDLPPIKIGKDGKRMILIPAGEFLRGTSDADILEMTLRFGWKSEWFDDEKPQRKIYLDAYYIAETPVTNEEYKKFVDATGHRVPYGWDENWRTYPTGKHDHPVVNVTWEDANAYARWVGGRLPTEAEWEKAARGTDGRRYPWGNDWDRNKCNTASHWVDEDVRTYEDWERKFKPRWEKEWRGKKIMTTLVGQFQNGASPYGCLDMAGNVWEWCADWYDAEYYKNSPARNPKNETVGSYRVLRGGSWFTDDDLARGACRLIDYPDNDFNYVGFRVVVSSSLNSEF